MRDISVVLGVCGGIAAYKSAALASRLTQLGARVRTVMTRGATEFVAPLTFQALTHESVYTDVFDERDPGRIAHIDLADRADLIIVAPATADAIARIAHGLGDDMLTTVLLAARCPVVLAPAMNVHMYENPIVRRNIDLLTDAGYLVAEPGSGPLACGYTGRGRLMEPDDIIELARMALADKPLAGRRVLVTAGPTRERIDPVRYLTNDSSGKMGYALAAAAWRYGARVTLISGPVALAEPLGVEVVPAVTASDMLHEVVQRAPVADALVMAAAVADYRPESAAAHKLKKGDGPLALSLAGTQDVLTAVRDLPVKPRFVAGFAAETQDGERSAIEKMRRKGLQMIVLNDVQEPGAGFGVDTNRVTLFFPDGLREELPLAQKSEVAEAIWRRIAARL